jgi:hypothetical protein
MVSKPGDITLKVGNGSTDTLATDVNLNGAKHMTSLIPAAPSPCSGLGHSTIKRINRHAKHFVELRFSKQRLVELIALQPPGRG